jgi:hypothetical protein
MGWKFLCCGSVEIIDVYNNYENYKSAGLHFVDTVSGRILVGEQPYKTIPCMSGFGGRREDDDGGAVYTAYRETVEELCGIKMTNESIRAMVNELVLLPQYSYYDDRCGYVFYVLTQAQLVEIMDYVWVYTKGRMAHYKGERPPRTIDQIMWRRVYTKKTEVCKLYNMRVEDLLVLGHSEPAEDDVDALPYPLDLSFIGDLRHINYWMSTVDKIDKKLKPAGARLQSTTP